MFKGGTYLWLFHDLQRFSEDLDFTSTGEIGENLPDEISKLLFLYGIENEVSIMKNNAVSTSFRILAKGPLNMGPKDLCSVYVEIGKRELVKLIPIPCRLDIPEYGLPIKIVKGMNLDEVGSEKVRAILTRNKPRDIYDLYYLIRQHRIHLNTDLINEKLQYCRLYFDSETVMERVMCGEKTFNRELKSFVAGELPDYKVVINTLKNWIQPQ